MSDFPMIDANETTRLDSVADEAWMAALRQTMAHHPHLKRRRIGLRREESRVTLEGCVHSYFEKQLAQEAVRAHVREREIRNDLVVTAG
jgi:hypothetical protein